MCNVVGARAPRLRSTAFYHHIAARRDDKTLYVMQEVRQQHMRIGLDFGGVIVRLRDNRSREDTSLDRADGIEIAHDGVLDGIRAMVALTGGSVWS